MASHHHPAPSHLLIEVATVRKAVDAHNILIKKLSANDPTRPAMLRQRDAIKQRLVAYDRQIRVLNPQQPTDQAAFKPEHVVAGADAAVNVVNHLLPAMQQFMTFVETTKSLGKLTGLASFERHAAPRPVASTTPHATPDALITPSAKAYLLNRDAAQDARATVDINALRDISLIHFYKRPGPVQTDADIRSLRDISLIHFYDGEDAATNAARFASAAPAYLHCATQRHDDAAALVEGHPHDVQRLVLWHDDSVLSWYLVEEGFPTVEDRTAVQVAMLAATAAWNRVRPGGVTFAQARDSDSATFVVVYAGVAGNKEAVGFLPNKYVERFSKLSIYGTSLKFGNRGALSNVLLHELGHILGFRHGFHVDNSRARKKGEGMAKASGASVMSLHYPPVLGFRDVVDAEGVYRNLRGDGVFEVDDALGTELKFRVRRISAKPGRAKETDIGAFGRERVARESLFPRGRARLY